MRIRGAMLIVCAAVFVAGCKGSLFPVSQGGQVSEAAASSTAQEAAQTGLVVMRSLVRQDNYQGLGFSSVEQAQKARLSDPMSLFSVPLDALTAFNGQGNGAGLLRDAHKSIYPVTVDEQVVSSLSVTQRGDGWRATDFGNSALTRALVSHKQSKDDFVVWVPAMKIYFSARGSGDSLILTPIMDDPRFQFKAGEALPAGRAFGVLQQAANGYNGLPQ